MPKPKNLKTKIFLDSGDPTETEKILELLGFLDGQTTNPSLVAKHPEARKRYEEGKKFSEREMLSFYRSIVQEISKLIPQGSVSIEVYADQDTTTKEMLRQAEEMYSWIPNAHIKFPTIQNGLEAANIFTQTGGRVNMTLVFTEEQAAAVYAATKGQEGDVFISPFIGRLDDIGINGIDLIKNCIKLYQESDKHVQILAASIRTLEHFLNCLSLESDIITAPYKILDEWINQGLTTNHQIPDRELQPIEFQSHSLEKDYKDYNIIHKLTDKGLAKFAEDWNKLLR